MSKQAKANRRTPWTLFVLAVAVGILAGVPPQTARAGRVEADRPSALVWRDPGDVAALDLFYGAGGKDHAPDPLGKFTFLKEDMNGTNPKFYVKDEQGVEWTVKMGNEPRAETAASRLLWGAGYFVDEDYYLESLKVEGLTKLRRGQKLVSDDGVVHDVRLKRHLPKVTELGDWSWFDNTCGPAQPEHGLVIMMALVNNWDLKTDNNSLREIDGERRCIVSDLGAAFGRTGNTIVRSKGVVEDYARSPFIANVTPTTVDLVMHSRPFFLDAVRVPEYLMRTRMEQITRHIPREDARWIGQRLALLSADQLHDCFRAAGFTPEEVDEYTKTVQHRIAELNAL